VYKVKARHQDYWKKQNVRQVKAKPDLEKWQHHEGDKQDSVCVLRQCRNLAFVEIPTHEDSMKTP